MRREDVRRARPGRVVTVLVGLGLLAAACGPGQYGFARYYSPLDAEEQYHENAREFPYGAVTANPDDFQDQLIGWFGIVERVEPAGDGRHKIRMTHHSHKDRHLCEGETNDSCRVTVHFKSSGGFSALVEVHPNDLVPSLDKLQPGSLVKVYGEVRCRENEDEQIECDYDELGGVLLEGEFYRQWPARYFVTTRAASSMRR